MERFKQKLLSACTSGDKEFVTECLSEGGKKGIDWEEFLSTAYKYSQREIVKCIQDSGNVGIQDILEEACWYSDVTSVSSVLHEDRNRGKDVDWVRLLNIAYWHKHTDIKRCIQDSGRLGLQDMLTLACIFGDERFVSRVLSETAASEVGVGLENDLNWGDYLCIANENYQMDIVRCIQDSGKLSLQDMLEAACMFGDMAFVSHVLDDNTIRKGDMDNLDWAEYLCTANENDQTDIVQCIQDSGRLSIQYMLVVACIFGDVTFVSHVLSENTDRGEEVDWRVKLMVAYNHDHMDIVTCIQDSGRVGWQHLIEDACMFGDVKLVTCVLEENIDRGEELDWNAMVTEAATPEQISVLDPFDVLYVSNIIGDRKGKGFDWGTCLRIAYEYDHTDIVRCIQDSGRLSLQIMLPAASLSGDTVFLERVLHENTDINEEIDWDTCLVLAYLKNHTDTVRCIQASGRISLQNNLMAACRYGDLTFVSSMLQVDTATRGTRVNWDYMAEYAYEEKQPGIVQCIQASRKYSLKPMLQSACKYGDVTFVSHVLQENTDRGEEVNWGYLLRLVYVCDHTDIVQCIQDSGRLVLQDTLQVACIFGDETFVSRVLRESIDFGENVEWTKLPKFAYQRKHIDIVRIIQDSKRVELEYLLGASCQYGDITFVSNIICENIDKGEEVKWRVHLTIAHKYGHPDIVQCIQNSGRVELQDMLMNACMYGDVTFVTGILHENTDRGQENLDWIKLLLAAYEYEHTNIVRCIHESGRLGLEVMLQYACIYGDVTFVSDILHMKQGKGKNTWEEVIAFSILWNYTWIVQFIATKGIDVGGFNNGMLLACLDGDMEYVRKFLDNNTLGPRACFCYFILSHACGHSDVYNAIIDSGYITLDCELLQLIMNIGVYKPALDYLMQRMDLTHTKPQPQITLLHIAQTKKLSRLLLAAGSDVNAAGYMGWTPLHMLCVKEKEDITELEKNLLNIEKQHVAIQPHERLQSSEKLIKRVHYIPLGSEEKIAVLHELMSKNANINAVDFNGRSPLHLACISGICITGITDLVTPMLNVGADIDAVDGTGMTPIALAAVHGFDEIAKILLERKCNPRIVNVYRQSPLFHACEWNHLNLTEILLKHSDINEADCDGVTPLSIAAWHGNTDIVSLLLDNHADANIVDKEGQTPIHKLAMTGYIETCRIITKCGIKLDTQDITGCTPLHIASQKHEDILSMLLEEGCKVNIQNNLGNTALHVAVLAKTQTIVDMLLFHKANINVPNYAGESPLACAVSALDDDMVIMLVERGADVHTVDNKGQGLVHAVVCNIKNTTISTETGTVPSFYGTTIVEYLLSKNLSVDNCEYNGQSPLHMATESGNVTAVHFLLEHGADFTIRDKFGHLPMMLAVSYPNIFKVLSERHLKDEDGLSEVTKTAMVRLAHWWDVSVLDMCGMMPSVHLEFAGAPQDAKALALSINQDQLSTWLRGGDNELPDFMSAWLPSLQPLTYVHHPVISEVIANFMKDLKAGVGEKEPLLAFDIIRCGSENEKTKTIAMDEQDIICMMKNITFDMFEPPPCPGDPVLKAFVEMVCKADYTEELRQVLDDKNRLSPTKLFQSFSKAVSCVLAKPDIWNKYPQIGRVTTKDITAGNKTISALGICWHDAIYPLFNISIDVVPAIAIPDWWPSWCNLHPIIKKLECIAVPKWKSRAPSDKALMEVGICKWGPVFEEMPEEMRQGYRLAKVVRDKAVCPQIEDWDEVHAGDFITSYMLKHCIVKQYAALLDDPRKKQTLMALQVLYGTTENRFLALDVCWAREIYTMMEEAFRKQYLESFFIPGYNLMNDDKYVQYQETAISYAKLCRRLLTIQSAKHFRQAYMGLDESRMEQNHRPAFTDFIFNVYPDSSALPTDNTLEDAESLPMNTRSSAPFVPAKMQSSTQSFDREEQNSFLKMCHDLKDDAKDDDTKYQSNVNKVAAIMTDLSKNMDEIEQLPIHTVCYAAADALGFLADVMDDFTKDLGEAVDSLVDWTDNVNNMNRTEYDVFEDAEEIFKSSSESDNPESQDIQNDIFYTPLDTSTMNTSTPVPLCQHKKESTQSAFPVCVPLVDTEWQTQRAFKLGLDVKQLLDTGSKVLTSNIAQMKTMNVAPDGNCFYRSLSYFVTGSELYHAHFRHLLVDWMKENNDIISETANQEDYANTSKVCQLGEYATEVEIFAAASMLNTPIWTYSPYALHDDVTEYQWQRHNPLPGSSSDFPLSDKCILLNNQHAHFEPVLDC